MNYIEKLSESKLGFSLINGQIITRSTFEVVIVIVIIISLFCVCRPPIDSVPGVTSGQKVVKLLNKNFMPLMLFYGKIFLYTGLEIMFVPPLQQKLKKSLFYLSKFDGSITALS